MMQLGKRGKLHSSFCGFSLVEIALSLVVLTILLATTFICSKGFLDNSKTTKTVREMIVIADSCRKYYQSNNSWPSVIDDLSPEYIKQVSRRNAFGESYVLTYTTKTVSVSSRVPKDIVKSLSSFDDSLQISNDGLYDKISITKLLPGEGLEAIGYDKKNLYKQ